MRLKNLSSKLGRIPTIDLSQDKKDFGGFQVGAELIVPTKNDSKIDIQPWNFGGRPWVPIFTSLERLDDEKIPEMLKLSSYMRWNARAFLDMVKDSDVTLNPHLDYGKLIPNGEIKELLSDDGSAFIERADKDVNYATLFKVRGEFAGYPFDLIDALIQVFSQHEVFEAAYLLLYTRPPQEEQYFMHVHVSKTPRITTPPTDKPELLDQLAEMIDKFAPGKVNCYIGHPSEDDESTRKSLANCRPFYVKQQEEG
ncbi:MAG: hypothetical protein SGARI_006543 [Bacillariaceae sp.]